MTVGPDKVAFEERKLPRKMGMLSGILVDTNDGVAAPRRRPRALGEDQVFAQRG